MIPRSIAVAVAGLLVAGCSSGKGDGRAPASENTASRNTTATSANPAGTGPRAVQEFAVPAGSHPHDVAAASDGSVWYTAQARGQLGRLDPATGRVTETPLGAGSAPHGVIVGPDGAPWVTDQGLNAIVRVDPSTSRVRVFAMPTGRAPPAVHTAVFDPRGTLWFTGNAGSYGRLTPSTGRVEVFDAPGGGGPYGITSTPAGAVYYASLGASYVGRVNTTSGAATVLHPPTPDQGSRRVWSDSGGRIWCSQWNAGQVARFDPEHANWKEWRLPGDHPQAYAVYVDDRDDVWLSDFGANAIVKFDPRTEHFTSFPLPSQPGEVRQIHGRRGEVWGAESAADKLVLIRT